ncbi:PAS domain-containing protein [Leptolyngbya sp. 15MV]|nr:PAS domain-containing protein [Leptolyngbya sp. 15MV]
MSVRSQNSAFAHASTTARSRRGLGAIRESLRAMREGETQVEALAVSQRFGPEAGAWNRLLMEREQLRRRVAADAAREELAKRIGGAGQLAQACDALWHGLVVIDDKQRIVYANGAAAVFLGTPRDRLTEGPFANHLRDAGVAEAVLGVSSGRVRRRTSVEVRRGGEHGSVLRFTARPAGRDDAGAVLLFIEDVTQQRMADEARNSFVAQATHELRTPLTNIRLYVEQAMEAGQDDAATRAAALGVIGREALRLERIVSDMLSVAEMEAGSLKLRADDVRLDAMFDDLREEFGPQAREKGLELSLELPPKLPVVVGDRDKIAQALHNLVGNAVKYTPKGGRVSVRVDAGPERLTIDVADTGVGIPAAELDLVFEKFYRASGTRSSDVPGTGLGLPLAREVARLHGGDVTARSEVGKGSTFTLWIPLASSVARAA